jgi:hypothetical protein
MRKKSLLRLWGKVRLRVSRKFSSCTRAWRLILRSLRKLYISPMVSSVGAVCEGCKPQGTPV